ncbi:hypothetical protein [Pseudoduganella umbonata]|uniref:Uncharacterized protein n=1 Tax=Pseudoduganella umbonata TaxID=864828 RepID=A0A4P8HYX2_9BURK|nr:hypothetical protein [Pseudoduganella umbonata]MBB3222014.1 hypothetical protein [Pseudoduganella umbonata]QCP14198.1 hypothetical protein FCL38_30125 [Pseudoduganella umbonata]
MAHQSRALFLALPALALWCCAGMAMAANPLGFAVAAAPSMFVLAVEEARGNDKDAKAAMQEREAALAAAEQARQVVQPAPQERAAARATADDRKVTLR